MECMVDYFKDKKVILYGYGVSNKAVEEVLIKSNIDFIIYIDGEQIPYIDRNCVVIKSNGIRPDTPFLKSAREKQVEVINDLELYSLFFKKGTVIGITGSNGKTTTSNLINKILKDSKFIGNNGVGVLSNQIDTKYSVIECSSFMLDQVESFHPNIFVILNIEYHHIDYHKSFSNYLDAKMKPLKIMNRNDLVVFNYDDRILRRCMGNYKLNIKSFSLEPNSLFTNCYLMDDAVYYEGKEFIKLKLLKSISKHNIQNIMAAIVVCKYLNVKDEDIKNIICELDVLPHRIEKFLTNNNISFYNDSKATNPYATISAIEYLHEFKNEEKLILIMGGKIIKDNYIGLMKVIDLVDEIYLFGENRFILYDLLKKNDYDNIFIFELLEEVVENMSVRVKDCAVILFSPASTSFDQFENYESRGNKFKELCFKYYNDLH